MPTSEFAASFARLAANHLWQSTGFAAVAVLLALALRANHARTRYWLWLAASVKFLVPFSVLAGIGASLGRWFVPATPISRLPSVMEKIVQPFAPFQDASVPGAASVPATTNLLPALLLAFWLCGFVAVLLYGWVRWRRVAAAVRPSTPLTEGRELEALRKLAQAIRLPKALRLVSSAAKLEPGVFGIFRPVLWLPAGIGDRLDDAELEAILAHELCHIRRRDNLLAVVHMAVEAIFWFHPLVWWLGSRLEEERERACDEEVVRTGGEPQIYAESILKVCEFYLASPVACAAGVTGGELKKRIEGIMRNRFTRKLSFGKRILLASAAIVVIAGPIVVGVTAQTRVSLPSFEVASVKPASPSDTRIGCSGGPGSNDPGIWSCSNVPLAFLISHAYGFQPYEFAPSSSCCQNRFDITAKVPARTTREEFLRMQQNLLAERFKLTLHHEQREMAIYELTVGEKGPKMKKSAPDAASAPEDPWTDHPPYAMGKDGYPVFPAGRGGLAGQNGHYRWTGFNLSVQEIVKTLSLHLGRPVVDATGLKAKYDIDMTWTIDLASILERSGLPDIPELPDNGPPGPTLVGAVQKQLCLNLNSKKGPGDIVVVDHVAKVPTEN